MHRFELQVRRIMGTVVAIVNGWLPDDFFSWATRPDLFIETPIAPIGYLYLAGARFDFNELVFRKALFRTNREHIEEKRKWTKKVHDSILENSYEEGILWLKELEEIVAPRIRNQLEKFQELDAKRLGSNSIKNIDLVLPSGLSEQEEKSYTETLSILRNIGNSGKWPSTSRARSRIIRAASGSDCNDDDLFIKSGSFTVVNDKVDHGHQSKLPLGNDLFPELVKSVFELEKTLCAENGLKRPTSTHCAINSNAEFTPHIDSGRGRGQSVSMIVGLGNYTGGGLYVEGSLNDIRYNPLEFDGWRLRHWTEPFHGERYSLVWFTPETKNKALSSQDKEEKISAFLRTLVSDHEKSLPSYPPLAFREGSTDENVITELLDSTKGCTYEYRDLSKGLDFSLEKHSSVLDIGAHIGVFVRYALSQGCSSVKAIEPEEENFSLLRKNTLPLLDSSDTNINIYKGAVAHIKRKTQSDLIPGINKNGRQNTWRHSLSDYNHYKTRNPAVATQRVDLIPFFGDNGALEPGITFVKLDCEGAEMDILLSEEASEPASWMDVSHLVFEWSFTKNKSIESFHEAVGNLRKAGFVVVYDGEGTFWDMDENEWPYFTDLVVFAARIK